jgi:hypothetical protein
MRRTNSVLRTAILSALTVGVLTLTGMGCWVGREARPVDVLGRRKCDEWLNQLGRKMGDIRLMTQGASDVFRITEAIHDARDRINTLKGTCARQASVSEQVQGYEQQLDAIEEQQVWGSGRH